MTYLSDAQLDVTISISEQTTIFLKELKERRSKDHKVQGAEAITKGKNKGKICRVKCSCGELTNYRVPLDSLSDFECPKKGK